MPISTEIDCLRRLYSPCLVAFKNLLDQDLSEVVSVPLSMPFYNFMIRLWTYLIFQVLESLHPAGK